MNNLQIITQRTVLEKDFTVYGDFKNPLFLAKDVAEWIDYAYKDSRQIHRDVSKMLSTVDDDEKAKYQLNLGGENCSHGGIRSNVDMWFLTEDGLYEVLMQSRKPIAKQFKKQVKAILKEIRMTGGHVSDDELFIKTYMPFADESTKQLFRLTLAAQRETNKRMAVLEETNEVLEIALDDSLKFCSVRKYNETNKMGWSLKQCQSVGKRLSAYCLRKAIDTREIPDPLFGSVKSYPLAAWDGFMKEAAQ